MREVRSSEEGRDDGSQLLAGGPGREGGGKVRRGEARKDEGEIVTAIIFSPFLVASLPPATRLSKMAAGRRSPILLQQLKLPSLNLKQSHPPIHLSLPQLLTILHPPHFFTLPQN